ncbi:MAG: HAD hydrolase family protein [Acidobacteria bacterium]|jgi:3-deoxy-D-manno-octulosonate 8-phosphate phosphatase (KDO 8-P phosphatase)|nr:HAD hydrolase family protein [Acidobacteriota bacterium]
MATTRDQLEARARNIRLVLLDVDGVLTDGTVAIAASGDEWKAFSIRDGAAIVWAKRSGLEIGLLSGRASEATTRRAKELNITLVLQGEADKRAAYMHLVTTLGLKDDQVAYMGDDLIDLPVLRRVGLAAAPRDACEDVRTRVHYVTDSYAGHGAVREFLELILRGRGRWDALLRSHLT